MRRYGLRLFQGAVLLALAALLFRFPAESAQAARQGIRLCQELLIPSLFPFFVLSSLLISTGTAGWLTRPLQALTAPLLGVSGAGAAALLLGAVGGYPVGVRTIAQMKARGDCSPAEARRMALFCNNCGPAFFIGAVGVGIFGSRKAGLLLLAVNLTAALLIGLFLRIVRGSAGREKQRVASAGLPLSAAFPECVRSSFAATLGVCGYVILFSVLTALLDCAGVLPLCQQGVAHLFPLKDAEGLSRSLWIGLMEISTGTAALREVARSPAALPVAAFLLGWGGFSVHGQSLPFLREADVPVFPYLLAKWTQGLLCAGLTALTLRLFPVALPAMAPLPVPRSAGLLGRELLALWGAAGLYYFAAWTKRAGKRQGDRL